jgi:gamma-resorcylate decarboxylase
MLGKVTLEDHFATPATLGDSQVFGAHVWSELGPRLLDFQDKRLRQMDAAGVEFMIVSLNAPAVQAIHDVEQAITVARAANDLLAEEVRKRPDRFAGLAALPMQDPEAAANELERCVRDLGFKGALVNGFSQMGAPDKIAYYDLPIYRPFWAAVERLDVPFYLHPRNPLPNGTPG